MSEKKNLSCRTKKSAGRFLSALLAVAMIFSMVPASVISFAADEVVSQEESGTETTPSDIVVVPDGTEENDGVETPDTNTEENNGVETPDANTEENNGVETPDTNTEVNNDVETPDTNTIVAPETETLNPENLDVMPVADPENTSLSLTWKDVTEGDATVLPLMDWNTRYSATFSVNFPTNATNKKIVVEPTTTAIQFVDSAANDSILAAAATVTNTKAGSHSNEFNVNMANSTWTYTMKDNATAFTTTLAFANSGVNSLFSSPAKPVGQENTLQDCIKATLSYTDGDGNEQTMETYLSVKDIKSVVPIATNGDLNKDYYDAETPRLVKAGETYTTGEVTCLAGIHFVKESDGSQFKVSIPIQKIEITMNFSKDLEIANTAEYAEIEGTRTDIGNGLYQAKFLYRGTENYYSYASYGQSYVNFVPQVKIPETAAQGAAYQLSVEQVDVYMHNVWEIGDENTAVANPTLYSFKRADGLFGTAYYKVNSLGTPWVNGFWTTLDKTGLTTNAREIDYRDVNWYNENYKEAVGMVGRFLYGCFGTTAAENQIVDLKFDSTAVGVRALRIPVPNDQYDKIVAANGDFSIQIATTKNPTVTSKTVTANALTKSTNWGCLYLDSKALGLADDEYVTELRFKLDTIPAYWSKSPQSGDGGCNWNFAFIFGRILDPTAGATETLMGSYTHTVQLFNGTEADVSTCPETLTNNSTEVGKIEGKITNTGRVDLGFTGPDVDGQHHYGVAVSAVNGKSRYSISGYAHNVPINAGDTVSIGATLYAVDKGTNTSSLSDLMGYTPITEIYIRDVFGEGISNLTITKNYKSQDENGNPVDVAVELVKNGQPAESGVTVTLDHTETTADSHGFYNKVYKVTFDSKSMPSKWDNVIGSWTDLGYHSKAGGNTGLQNAQMNISYDIKVPNDFGTDVDAATGLSKRMGEEIPLNESIWVKAESGITKNANDIEFQHHDQYVSVYHGDTYDVDGDGYTVYKKTEDGAAEYGVNNDTITVQGDYDIQRTVYAHNVTLTQPTLRTDLAFDNDIKETDKGDGAYRTYDAKDKVTSTVNIAEDDGILRLLVANFSTTQITDLSFYVPIPKKGETWGEHTTEAFPFSVKLTGELKNADPDVFTVTYGKINPAATDDDFENQAGKFEAYNAANAADYNCIRIVAAELPMGETGETNLDQYKRTKYFTAPIAYADAEKPNELLYDVWTGAAHYTATAGESHATTWYATEALGIRAKQLKAEADVTNGTYTLTSTTPKSNVEFVATITANANYDLPAAATDITVTIDGVAYTGFTYDKTTGKVTIPAAAVTGNIKVVAVCTAKGYTAKNTVTNGSADGGNTAAYGTDYVSNITANEHYNLPADKSKVTVTVGGKSYTGFEYDTTTTPGTGKVTIPGTAVTGDIVITAECTKESFKATNTITNGSADGAATVDYGTEYVSNITANDHYDLPADKTNITVTVGGNEYTGFTYDKTTGKVTVPAADVTGDIVIVAECTPKTFNDTNTVTNGNGNGSGTPTYGTPYTSTITTDDAHNLPTDKSKITVTIGGEPYTDFTYDPETGVVTVPGTAVTGDIVVTAECTPKMINVTTTVTNGSHDGTDTATYGEEYSFTITPAKRHVRPETAEKITVTIGGEPYTDFTYDRSTGKVTVPGTAVTGDIVVTAECPKIVYDDDDVTPVKKDNTKTETATTETATTEAPVIPETGDNTNLGLWMALLAASLLGIIGLGVASRKKNRKN